MSLALKVLNGELRGRVFPIREGAALTVGRDACNTIRLKDRKLSRIHCQVEVLDGQCQLADLNSTNGTMVNGERIYEETRVGLQDRIAIGTTQLRLIEIEEEESSEDAVAFGPASEEASSVVCEECGASIAAGDMAAGRVRHVGERHYCTKCAALFSPDEDDRRKPTDVASEEEGSSGERFEPGKIVAGARIVSLVGEGRLGPLYEAEQISMGRMVALKILDVTDKDWARRYLDAVYASGKLVHPNILLIFDAGEMDGMYYVIREYVAGESVEERMAAHVPVSLDEAFNIVSRVAYALEYAFEHRTFHGALSPRKIILGPNAAVKVTCFGLPQTLPSGIGLSHLRSHGLPYTAPERLSGAKELNFASDCYSLVAVFYHLLSGHPPFQADSREKLEDLVRNSAPKPLLSVNPSLPEAVERVVDRGLCKDSRARFQTPRELLFDLEENVRRAL